MFAPPLIPSLIAVVAAIWLPFLLMGVRERRVRRRLYGKEFAKPTSPTWNRRLSIAITVGAIVSLVLSLSQVGVDQRVTQATVVLAIDVSKSMNATDVQPSRLVAARDAAQAFLQKVPPGFRVGVVTFADAATVLVSPGPDRASATAAVATLESPDQSGTVIGDGLTAAIDAIGQDEAQTNSSAGAIVLLTDGRDSGSVVAPDDAAARAQSLGIPVFTVAVGADSGSEAGANVGLLTQIADTTGAQTFTAATTGELTKVYDELGSRLSYDLAVGAHAELFLVVSVALVVVATGFIIVGARRRDH